MSTARKVAVTGGLAGALLVAGLALLLWPRGATTITEKEAVAAFRDGDRSTAITRPDPTRSTPQPGVYKYASEGQEEVKLGPLPAETRAFPRTVAATSVDSGPGCFDWRVDLFAEHTEETRWCTEPVLRLVTHTKHQTVGALTPTFTMTCDPAALQPDPAATSEAPATSAEDGSTTALTCNLEVGGGPVSVKTTIAGTATVAAAAETIDVGGVPVTVTKTSLHFPVTGTVNGVWDETMWWSSSHLPVRVERKLDLSGPATFKETSEHQLTSLTPVG